MNASQIQRLASAYKAAKSVLSEIEDGKEKHTIFVLSSAVGSLETLCLRENLLQNQILPRRLMQNQPNL